MVIIMGSKSENGNGGFKPRVKKRLTYPRQCLRAGTGPPGTNYNREQIAYFRLLTHSAGEGIPVFLMDECDNAPRVLNNDGETKRIRRETIIKNKQSASARGRVNTTKINKRDHNLWIHGEEEIQV
jgi:hypothetical protein